MKSEAERHALATRLYARRKEAVVVSFVECSLGDWKPSEHECHRNVDWWVFNHAGCKAVRGWMFFDFHRTSMGLLPAVRFTAHSVVEDSGGLYDITPSRASQRYPFIKHEGTEEDFISLVEGHRLVHLDLIVGDKQF